MMLAAQRLRGRFRYGTRRLYAIWSLCRFVPYLLILTAAVFGGIEIRQRQQAAHDRIKTAELRATIGLHEQLSLTELSVFWELAESNDAVRDNFFVQALEYPATAEQFNRRVDMAVQATVGLDPAGREKVFCEVVSPCLRRLPPDLSRKLACVKIAVGLSIEGGDLDFGGFAVATLIESIKQTSDREPLRALAEALKAVVEKRPAAEAERVFAQLLAAMKRTRDPVGLWVLAQALGAMPGSLELQALINALKWPVSVGALRSSLLDMLEKQTGQKFDGNLWKMVDWAQQNGLDVKSPPTRPSKSSTSQ